MTKAHPPPPPYTADDVPHACPPLAPLTNGAPPADDKQQHDPTNNKPTMTNTTLKTIKLCLPHPCSLDVLPSPTNKWSMTTHQVRGWAYGYLGYHIFYKHFYFHQSHVLHTKAFAPSTTATTTGDGGKPQSIELDDVTGHNCAMPQDKYVIFTMLVLGVWPRKMHGNK